jgi:hypothetical protein
MMAIPEAQLDTWSKQGSVVQSRDTYATVKKVLEDSDSPYYLRDFESFLQGSYANDTNVYRDSDVDIVMRLDSTWYHDAVTLSAEQYAAFERAHPGSAGYGLSQFKAEVANWLKQKFGNGVTAGSKAIFIPGNGTRRDCDVLPCANFRYYYRFNSLLDQSYAEGICFFLRDGTRIVNFPKQHSENCTAKHKATNQWFKPTVRIFKNMRNHMVNNGTLKDGIAPSYFIEGLLWNVPSENYGTSYDDTFVKTFNFLVSTDRKDFFCANGIHFLLRDNSHVSWPPANCEAYLSTLRDLWNNWS